jgi:hypothetical protein
MRTLSISYVQGFLVISYGKANMTNPVSAAINARCGFFVWPIVRFRGVRPDPGGAFDDSRLTAFGCVMRC